MQICSKRGILAAAAEMDVANQSAGRKFLRLTAGCLSRGLTWCVASAAHEASARVVWVAALEFLSH